MLNDVVLVKQAKNFSLINWKLLNESLEFCLKQNCSFAFEITRNFFCGDNWECLKFKLKCKAIETNSANIFVLTATARSIDRAVRDYFNLIQFPSQSATERKSFNTFWLSDDLTTWRWWTEREPKLMVHENISLWNINSCLRSMFELIAQETCAREGFRCIWRVFRLSLSEDALHLVRLLISLKYKVSWWALIDTGSTHGWKSSRGKALRLSSL